MRKFIWILMLVVAGFGLGINIYMSYNSEPVSIISYIILFAGLIYSAINLWRNKHES